MGPPVFLSYFLDSCLEARDLFCYPLTFHRSPPIDVFICDFSLYIDVKLFKIFFFCPSSSCVVVGDIAVSSSPTISQVSHPGVLLIERTHSKVLVLDPLEAHIMVRGAPTAPNLEDSSSDLMNDLSSISVIPLMKRKRQPLPTVIPTLTILSPLRMMMVMMMPRVRSCINIG